MPKCLGVILDGNRRWARERGLPTLEGHRRGFLKTRELFGWAHDAGITDVIIYAFSTENWNRSPEEVAYLMDLYEEFCDSWTDELMSRNARIRFIGQRERFRDSLRTRMDAAEERSKNGNTGTLWVCLSYGGRAELLAGVNALLAQGASSVDEAGLRAALWSAQMPDPDLIIRTGGEQRLSNFLTWQSVYSELAFVPSHLPGLTREEFHSVLSDFGERERRRGK